MQTQLSAHGCTFHSLSLEKPQLLLFFQQKEVPWYKTK